MRKVLLRALFISTFVSLVSWLIFYVRGKQFARRDRLQKADAIVVLAGARGNRKFLDGKIQTAVRLYQEGWAPFIICSGRFSVALTSTPQLIPLEELKAAATAGRIQEKDVAVAAKKWDEGLGATYMRGQVVRFGVPEQAVLVEDRSLHTRENAEYILELMKKQGMHRIILVTSPFHQLRTYLTFAKVFQPDGFDICLHSKEREALAPSGAFLNAYGYEMINYYADTGEWHPLTWFFSKENRKLVESEQKRIIQYRLKGDLL